VTREEFEEILQVLLEVPLTGRRPPSTENSDTNEAARDSVSSDKQRTDRNCKGAAS
jgi:hypothetical protein